MKSEYAEGVRKSMSEPFRPYNKLDREARSADRYERCITVASWVVGCLGTPLIVALVVYNLWRYLYAH